MGVAGDAANELEHVTVAASTSQSIARTGRGRRRGHRRHRVDDVAEGAQPDDQDPHRRRLAVGIRASRSRVEWSFGSPTIAVRPPYAATMARSGTDSTV